MTSMLRPVLALCLAGFFSFSSAQEISTTGNLITNQWSGVSVSGDLDGQHPISVFGCCTSFGSGAFLDNSTGNANGQSGQIIWSYGQATVSQTLSLNQALSGTGIQINGYNWGYELRNMNGDDRQGGVDRVTASILTYASDNMTLRRSDSWIYNTQFDWTTFSGTVNYNVPGPVSEFGNMRIEFTSMDSGFWAGYYGPQVRNVSLSVNYSFDPCASDPLYSSSCSGYFEAYMANLAAMLGWGSAAESDFAAAMVDYSLPTTAAMTAMTEDITATTPTVDAGGVEVGASGELSVPDGIPDVVKEESREKKTIDANLLGSILERARDDSEALAVANRSQQDSISDAANPDFTGRGIDTNGDVVETDLIVSLLRNAATNAGSAAEASDSTSGETVTGVAADTGAVTATVAESVRTTDTMSDSAAEPPRRQAETNEAAGGVDIAVLAQQPIGFDQYLTQALSDARFYQEREIYPGQQTVDNRRAQRLLSGANDRVHQSMVDQQYRRP